MRIYLYYLLYCMCFYFNQKFQALRTNESLTRNTNINMINLYKIIIFIILLLYIINRNFVQMKVQQEARLAVWLPWHQIPVLFSMSPVRWGRPLDHSGVQEHIQDIDNLPETRTIKKSHQKHGLLCTYGAKFWVRYINK